MALAAQHVANSSSNMLSRSSGSTSISNGLVGVQDGSVPTSVAATLGSSITLTPSLTINALAAAAAAHQQNQVTHNLHGLSP